MRTCLVKRTEHASIAAALCHVQAKEASDQPGCQQQGQSKPRPDSDADGSLSATYLPAPEKLGECNLQLAQENAGLRTKMAHMLTVLRAFQQKVHMCAYMTRVCMRLC